jgi:hypothetical protein
MRLCALQNTNLAMLNVGGMALEGSVPVCLFNNTALYQLSASGNRLTGSIPEVLYTQNLTILDLSHVRGEPAA